MSEEEKLPRRQSRENAFLAAFALTFQDDGTDALLKTFTEDGEITLDTYAMELLQKIAAHRDELDGIIESHLKGWSLGRIPRASMTALRIALTEMLYSGEEMTSIAINEAVELVKKYGADGDYQFVNGLLGTVARERAGGDGLC